MKRSIDITALIVAAAIVLQGCTGPHPAIMEGDANSARVSYSGDAASTLPLARKHCAQFEKVPRLVDPGTDLASYDCVKQ